MTWGWVNYQQKFFFLKWTSPLINKQLENNFFGKVWIWWKIGSRFKYECKSESLKVLSYKFMYILHLCIFCHCKGCNASVLSLHWRMSSDSCNAAHLEGAHGLFVWKHRYASAWHHQSLGWGVFVSLRSVCCVGQV